MLVHISYKDDFLDFLSVHLELSSRRQHIVMQKMSQLHDVWPFRNGMNMNTEVAIS